MQPENTIAEFLTAAEDAITGGADNTADFVRGSDYESLTGPPAVIWSRESQRDTDLFRAIRFNDATGDQLTEMVKDRYGIDRILDAKGSGVATFTRLAGGTTGTIWKGTRIGLVGGPLSNIVYYLVKDDTFVGITATEVQVPIESMLPGPAYALETRQNLRLEDPLWDDWSVDYLRCDEGTLFEEASALRARVRQTRRNQRVGHEQAFIDTCAAVGASNVAIFRSDFGGDAGDVGLNVCYVADSGFNGTPDLVKACQIALWSTRVWGDYLQVLPMRLTALDVEAVITLRASPAAFDVTRLRRIHEAAIAQYLGGLKGRFTYSRVGILSSIAKQTPVVQDVNFITPSSDTTILTSGNFPEVLNRYVPGSIHLSYIPPT